MGTHPIFESDFDCLTEMVENEKNDRFSEFKSDPKYKTHIRRNKHAKVKIDPRFTSMLDKDSAFDLKWKRDRKGRTIRTSQKENLDRFYRISKKQKSQILDGNKDYDRARGIGVSESSESESDSDSEVEEESNTEQNDIYDHDNPVRTDDVFKRIAITNMDWDRINSQDLFVLANSPVKPELGGRLNSVTVYLSQLGQSRIKDEEKNGPKMNLEIKDEEERKRVYQLERLKYFYAVCETDSPSTADLIYNELDGTDYGESGVKVDLRFIPDEISFDDDEVRILKSGVRAGKEDRCTGIPIKYAPPDFVTDVLSRSKVEITWDGKDKKRQKCILDQFKTEINRDEVQHLVASESESDGEQDEEKRLQLRNLLGIDGESTGNFFESAEPDPSNETGDKEFEIEQNADNGSDGSDALISDDENEKKKPEMRIEKDEEIETEEMKKQRQELELLFSSSDEEGNKQKHFDLREEEKIRKLEARKEKKKRFKKKKVKEEDGIDLTDSRFSKGLLEDPNLGIDRTHPSFKYNKSHDEIQKRRKVKNERTQKSNSDETTKRRNLDENRDIIARLKMRNKK